MPFPAKPLAVVARNGGFVDFWEVDRMSRGLSKLQREISETIEEAKQYFADPSGSSKPVGTIESLPDYEI
jgi:hypothetical protein